MPKWVSDIGGSGSCISSYLRVDAQNNTYVTGIFEGIIDFDPSVSTFNLTATGGFDAFVAKYDTNGNLIWAKSMGGAGTDQPSGMDLDNNGNVTIVGQFNSPIDANPGAGVFSLNNASDFDMFIINLDANGNFLWAKSIGGSGADYGNKVAIDKDGNRIMIGQFQQTVQVGTVTYSTSGTFNGLIAKYDAAGNYLWSFSLGASGDNKGVGIETDNNKDIIISGTFSGTVNFNPLGASYNLSSPGTASYIAKYTSSGQLIWVKVITGNTATNIAVDRSSNNIFATGTYSTVTFDPGNTLNAAAGQAMFIARYAQDGSFIWAKGVDGSNASVSNNGITVKNDNVYISGYFNGTVDFDGSMGSAIINYHGQRDFFLLKYNIDGDYQWAVTAGNNSCGNTLGRAVGIDGNNDVLFSGTFCSTINFDVSGCTSYNLTATSPTRDAFLAKYTPSATGLANNIITAPIITSFCGPFDPAVILGSTPTGGVGTYTYQWQSSANGINFADIPGASGKDYDPPSATGTTYFRRMVGSGNCNLDISSNTIQINQQNTIANNVITAPSVVQFCGSGDPAVITGSTPTGGNSTYAFQWQNSNDGVNFSDVTGATLNNLDPGVISVTTYYRRKVTSGGCDVISNIVEISVQPPIANNQLAAPVTTSFCSSTDPDAITGSTPTGGVGTYAYQWQSSSDGINFTDLSGATLKDFDAPVINSTVYYQRIVTSGSCATSLSNMIQFSAQPAITNNQINAPSATAFCGNGDPDVITGSTPTGGNGVYVFQWQSAVDGINFTDITGATSKDHDPLVINSTVYYRRKVRSGSCETASNIIQLQVQSTVSANTISAQLPTTFCVYADPGVITGNIPPGAFTYIYQWQSTTDNIHFADIPGAITNNYDPPSIAMTTYFRRIVSSAVCVVPLISNVVVIRIDPAVANNTITSPVINSFCSSGEPGNIVGSTPEGGDGTYSYMWQSSTDGIAFSNIGGAIAKDFDPPTVTITTYFRRIVTSGSCNIPQNSNVIKITVDVMPVITLQAEVTICQGANTTLNPIGGDSNFTYQWSPAAGLSNTTSSNTVASPTVTTLYTLTISNGLCSTTITTTVNVIPPPTVDAGKDKEILKGGSVLLDAVVTGNDLQYNWSPTLYLDNPNIANPTASPPESIAYTLTVTSANNCFIVFDDVFVKVYPKIAPPNTFTPNHDGINDVWEISGLSNYSGSVVSVFNRNGELLYRSIGYSKAWDGSYNGRVVPFGNYYYTIDLKNGTKGLSGWVAVVK
ncbi:T9SS type B sorting domain-containing protein [Mucilaginibacter sp. HD30]